MNQKVLGSILISGTLYISLFTLPSIIFYAYVTPLYTKKGKNDQLILVDRDGRSLLRLIRYRFKYYEYKNELSEFYSFVG